MAVHRRFQAQKTTPDTTASTPTVTMSTVRQPPDGTQPAGPQPAGPRPAGHSRRAGSDAAFGWAAMTLGCSGPSWLGLVTGSGFMIPSTALDASERDSRVRLPAPALPGSGSRVWGSGSRRAALSALRAPLSWQANANPRRGRGEALWAQPLFGSCAHSGVPRCYWVLLAAICFWIAACAAVSVGSGLAPPTILYSARPRSDQANAISGLAGIGSPLAP